MGREPKGFPDLEEIAKLFAIDLAATGARASSSKASQQEGLKVENLLEATPAKVALQNDHMELGHLHLGQLTIF